jgi:ferritin
MISQKLTAAINKQIGEELYSAYLYLSMAAYYESQNLKGFGQWLRVQHAEELAHAQKFFDYLIARGGSVELPAIAKPTATFPSPHLAFGAAYEHERKITKLINGLYELALAENDYASQSFLRWFIDEQVEEEASSLEIAETLKKIGEKGSGIFMLDHRLAKRGST